MLSEPPKRRPGAAKRGAAQQHLFYCTYKYLYIHLWWRNVVTFAQLINDATRPTDDLGVIFRVHLHSHLRYVNIKNIKVYDQWVFQTPTSGFQNPGTGADQNMGWTRHR